MPKGGQKGRPRLTDEEKAARLIKKQAAIVESPAHKFFVACQPGGIYVTTDPAHKCGHFIGVQRLASGKPECEGTYEDVAVVIFEVMEGVGGVLLRKPRYSNSAHGKQVTYPQMTIEWGQAAQVADAIMKLVGGKGKELKQEVEQLKVDVGDMRKTAAEADELSKLSQYDV